MRKETLITALVFLSFGFLAGYVYKAQTSAGTIEPQTSATEAAPAPGPAADSRAAPDSSGAALPPGHPPVADPAVIQTLEQQATANPQDPALPLQLANYLYDHGDFEQAIGWYQKAVRLNPKSVNASTDLGTCYFNAGRFDDAIAQFRHSLAIDPEHQPTLFNLVVVNMEGKHDYRTAEKTWETLHRLNPNYPNLDQLKQRLDEARGSGSS